jgi:hypothetical protein
MQVPKNLCKFHMPIYAHGFAYMRIFLHMGEPYLKCFIIIQDIPYPSFFNLNIEIKIQETAIN